MQFFVLLAFIMILLTSMRITTINKKVNMLEQDLSHYVTRNEFLETVGLMNEEKHH